MSQSKFFLGTCLRRLGMVEAVPVIRSSDGKWCTVMQFSVIVPAFNAASTLPRLLDSLARQSYRQDFEIIIIDDGSTDKTAEIAAAFQCKLVRMKHNRGPAHCRNYGAKIASGEFLIFTDSDCCVAPDWLERLGQHLSAHDTDSIMGRLILLPSNLLGDSISALGFPAGGSVGFDKIWKVDDRGFTTSLSTCNCAVRRKTFARLGGFDESFPYAGGEDSLLAYNLLNNHYKIKYCPDVIVYHEARDSLTGFLRWQFKRGISSYIFSRKVENKKQFVALRCWSLRNVLGSSFRDRRFPLVVPLLGFSFVAQGLGFLHAKVRRKRA